MTMHPEVRPPPSTSRPYDFDDDMERRWQAWATRGRAERAETVRRAQVALAVAGAIVLAAALLAP